MAAEPEFGRVGLHRREMLTLAVAGAAALISGPYGNVMAADGERKMGWTTVTRLLENERVGVVRMISKPGDKGEMKQRPERILYIIRGAKVRFRYPGGKTEDHGAVQRGSAAGTGRHRRTAPRTATLKSSQRAYLRRMQINRRGVGNVTTFSATCQD